MRLPIFVACTMAFLMLLMPIPKALADRDLLWDTIAEWDAGTKQTAPGGGDNTGLQTITDNPSVGWGDHSNMLQSASTFGDHFLYASADADTIFWHESDNASCVDTGDTQDISAVDGPGSDPDAGDGSMRFLHSGANRSMRSSNIITGVSDFLWEARFAFSSDDWSAANFSWVLAAPDPNTNYVWCGGLVSTNPAYGGGWYFTGNQDFIRDAQAFTYGWNGTANVFTVCSPVIQVDLEPLAQIERRGSYWIFRLYNIGAWTCAPTPGPQIPLRGVFDLNGTGIAFIDYHYMRYWTPGEFLSPPTRNTYEGTCCNWTSPSTAGQSYERVIRIAIWMSAEYPQVGFGIANLSLVSATDWTLIYQPADWLGSPCIGEAKNLFCIFYVNETIADGPYRVRIFPVTNTVTAVWIISIQVFLTGALPPTPNPDPGTPGTFPPQPLANMSGIAIFCGIAASIVIVFLLLLRRVKNA